MNTIHVPVSLGEAFDKLSILDIKSQRISNEEKLAKIILERNTLFTTLRDMFTSNELIILYGQLLHVNSLLWDVEDFLRDLETNNDTANPKFTQFAREVYVLNDRRAEVKRAIDNLLGSQLQEVKSYANYKKGKLLLLPHMGLGDMIILNGFIRYKSLFHTEVRVVVFKKYADSVRFMFRDLNNITYEEVLCEADISPNYAMVVPRRLSELVEEQGYEYLPLGVHGRDALWQTRAYDFAECFYLQGGVPYEVRRRFGYIMRDIPSENAFAGHVKDAMGGGKYRILHDDPERKLLIDRTKLKPGSPFFHVATKEINGKPTYSNNIFDYCTLIDGAEEYHGMDSSFALMLDLIRCKCPSINIHAYVKRDIHAKLYPNIAVNFVGAGKRSCVPITIDKPTDEALVNTIRAVIKDHPNATHIVAVEKGCNLVADMAEFLTFRDPLVWSDYAAIAIGHKNRILVFPVARFGQEVNARTTWYLTHDPCRLS